MPIVHLKGMSCTGHGCFGSRPNTSGDPYLKVHGIPVHFESGSWASHCCGPACHGGTLSAGSSYLKVHGKGVARVGDPVDCGSVCSEGDPYLNIVN